MFGEFSNGLLNSCLKELKKKENRDKIMNDVIDPIVSDITCKYYPHFLLLTILQFLMVILLGVILAYIIMNNKKK